ncbi:hypothetical protein LG047_07855 [Methylocystis sp. WRRC1]|uniref:hypothetical protein n=1 Tax=Methylocystis sp. WRRC1 TaxID=1732014 RepID=UPI001D147E56|nr:hypothetical protein [Methylocystis sp. WRRC1]MCC3245234.1 hypothetical protein [Methylocystis sp. WRRC1]
MARIEILPVDGLSRFLVFCKLPRLIYAGAKGFAPPLDLERWTLFAHMLNPHYKLVEDQKFLARRDGQWVGRISAHVYKDGITPVGASPAQFGALDAIDDLEVVRALTEAAENWLREKGATRANGPFSPTINGECGMLVEGFEATPMIFMPWHPPYLSRHLEALGYTKAQDLISYRFELDEGFLNEAPRISNRREWRDRLKLRPLNMDALKTGETALMQELFNDGWSGNWGFVPFTKAEFDSTADALKFVMPPEFGIVVELDGVPQSFVIALPNLFEIVADMGGKLFPFGLPRLISRMRHHKFNAARIVLLGTRKALQNSATGGAILLAMIEEMRRRGASASIKHLEAGWVLENNLAMRKPIEMFGGKVDKIHRIYERRLSGDGEARRAPDSVSANPQATG